MRHRKQGRVVSILEKCDVICIVPEVASSNLNPAWGFSLFPIVAPGKFRDFTF